MGQYWNFINIDKLESVGPRGGMKMGEFFFNSNPKLLKCLAAFPEAPIDNPVIGNWAGDRIICLGDYAEDLPSGVITEDDVALLEKLLASDEDQDGDNLEFHDYHDGAALASRLDRWATSIERRIYSTYSRYSGDMFPQNTVWALRNISKKEFIRSDKIQGCYHDANNHDAFSDVPGLFQVFVMRTGWSGDPSCAMAYNEEQYDPPSGMKRTLLNEGAWAGNRLDIVMVGDDGARLFDEGWSDVSEEAASQMKDIFSSSGYSF